MKIQTEKAERIKARMQAEFEHYKSRLMRKDPEDILKSTYQTLIYQELMALLSSEGEILRIGADPDQLLALPDGSILDTLYYEWIKSDIQSDLSDCLSAVIYRKFGSYN